MLRLRWHSQEFEKLAGRPYVVCFFNADAPMTVLPDTVSLSSTAQQTRSLLQLTPLSCCKVAGRTIEWHALVAGPVLLRQGPGGAAADAGSHCAGVVPGAARSAAAAAPRAAAGHLSGAPCCHVESPDILVYWSKHCVCDKRRRQPLPTRSHQGPSGDCSFYRLA